MENFNSLQEVSDFLNKKYAKITDFRTYVNADVLKGGFYKMNFDGTPQGEYYFHETFVRLTEYIKDFNELFIYADKIIQKQLNWQKWCDEEIAKEKNKPVAYLFDYSLIEG